MQIASLQPHKVRLPEVPPCEVTGDSATIVASKGGGGFKEGFGGALQYSWSFGMKPAQDPCVFVSMRQADWLFLIAGPACGSLRSLCCGMPILTWDKLLACPVASTDAHRLEAYATECRFSRGISFQLVRLHRQLRTGWKPMLRNAVSHVG